MSSQLSNHAGMHRTTVGQGHPAAHLMREDNESKAQHTGKLKTGDPHVVPAPALLARS